MRMLTGCRYLLILALMAGCAAAPKAVAPKKVYYSSRPAVLNTSNETFSVQIRPIKLDHPFYVGFQLTIENKSSNNLSIDWNKTRYVHNGQDQGIFVYKGIDADTINAGIPKETIAAGEILSKPIYPRNKLGFKDKRDLPQPGKTHFFPGILPNGRNSALLAVQQGDRRWRELLTFEFDTEQMP